MQPTSRAMSTQPLGPIDGVLAVGGAVRGECPVDRPRVFPEPRGDDLDEQPLAVEDLLDLGDALAGCLASRGRPARCRRRGTARRRSPAPCRPCSLRAYSISWRTVGPNGSAPVLMFQGPNEKRYLVGVLLVGLIGGRSPQAARVDSCRGATGTGDARVVSPLLTEAAARSMTFRLPLPEYGTGSDRLTAKSSPGMIQVKPEA